MPLFAVDAGDAWLAALFIGVGGVITVSGVALVNYMTANQKGKATTFSEMQAIVKDLTERVGLLEVSRDAALKELREQSIKTAACEAREQAISRWAEANNLVGFPGTGSGTHRPITFEGADQ